MPSVKRKSQKHTETNPTDVHVSAKHIVGGGNVQPCNKFPGATIFI